MLTLTEEKLHALLLKTNPHSNYNAVRGAQTLYLCHVKGYKHREIAAHLNIPTSQVGNTLARAEGKLRTCWPLFATGDVALLHASPTLRAAIWPRSTAPT